MGTTSIHQLRGGLECGEVGCETIGKHFNSQTLDSHFSFLKSKHKSPRGNGNHLNSHFSYFEGWALETARKHDSQGLMRGLMRCLMRPYASSKPTTCLIWILCAWPPKLRWWAAPRARPCAAKAAQDLVPPRRPRQTAGLVLY